MQHNLFLAILIFCSSNLIAQTIETKNEINNDPIDVSIQKEQIEKYGIPTISAIKEMKDKADALYDSHSWEEAATAYEIYAKHVNWLANLLSQCVEPYYSASYDDRKSIPQSIIRPLIPFESKANECKRNRNEAFVKIGICYKNMGDIKNAVVYLHKGLDLIDIKDDTYWKLAAEAMAEILEFDPE